MVEAPAASLRVARTAETPESRAPAAEPARRGPRAWTIPVIPASATRTASGSARADSYAARVRRRRRASRRGIRARLDTTCSVVTGAGAGHSLASARAERGSARTHLANSPAARARWLSQVMEMHVGQPRARVFIRGLGLAQPRSAIATDPAGHVSMATPASMEGAEARPRDMSGRTRVGGATRA